MDARISTGVSPWINIVPFIPTIFRNGIDSQVKNCRWSAPCFHLKCSCCHTITLEGFCNVLMNDIFKFAINAPKMSNYKKVPTTEFSARLRPPSVYLFCQGLSWKTYGTQIELSTWKLKNWVIQGEHWCMSVISTRLFLINFKRTWLELKMSIWSLNNYFRINYLVESVMWHEKGNAPIPGDKVDFILFTQLFNLKLSLCVWVCTRVCVSLVPALAFAKLRFSNNVCLHRCDVHAQQHNFIKDYIFEKFHPESHFQKAALWKVQSTISV